MVESQEHVKQSRNEVVANGSNKAKVSELSKFLNTSKPTHSRQKIPVRNTFTIKKKSLSKTNGNSPKAP